MIKKLWIFSLITLSFITLSFINVQAEDEIIYDEYIESVSFDFTNLFSSYYALLGSLTLKPNTEYINITIPQSDYHVPEAGGLNSVFTVYFSDGTDEEVNFLGVFGGELYGNGTINFKALYPTKWYLVNEIGVTLVQNITSAPSGYVQYMTDNNLFTYYVNTGKFEPRVVWSIEFYEPNPSTQMWRMKGVYYNIWEDVKTITLYIPPSEYFRTDYGDYNPRVTIYDTETLYESYSLLDFGNFTTGLFFIDLIELDIDVDTVKSMIINIPTNFTVVPPQFVTYIADSATMTFNERIFEIRYYDLEGAWLQQYSSEYYVEPRFDAYPLDDVGILKFQYYVYPDGKRVYFENGIDPSYILNNRLNLYAFYRAEIGTATEVPDPIPDVNTFTNVLDAFGWNNNVGYIAILIIITALITVPLILLGVPLLVISIVNIAITSFFTYMGLLPTIAIIILYLLWFSMIVASFRRSDVYE